MRRVPRPRVLIGGLGLGFTLRAVLDRLPKTARVVVSELNDKVVEWCRGPVAPVNNDAASDRRVEMVIGDVMDEIRRIAGDGAVPRYDAILWDLYIGPKPRGGSRDPLYGDSAVKLTWKALGDGGVFGVWGETPSPAFEARLKRQGFEARRIDTGAKGGHHPVYLSIRRPARRRWTR